MHRESGTTLLELLVAMALLALIAAYGLSTVRSFQNFERVERRIERQQALDATADYIRRAISGARPVFLAGAADRPQPAFLGTKHAITFVTAADPRLDYGGLYLVRFRLEGRRLVMDRLAFRASLNLEAIDASPVLLIDGPMSLDLSFYGAPRWTDKWADRGEFPWAVRLTLGDTALSMIIPLEIAR